jgi:hypothetical protein
MALGLPPSLVLSPKRDKRADSEVKYGHELFLGIHGKIGLCDRKLHGNVAP